MPNSANDRRTSPHAATYRSQPTRISHYIAAACLVLVASCGGDGEGPLGECPPNSGDQQSAGSFIFSNTCTGCHSVNLQGAGRQGAPVGTDYDTSDMILDDADDIWARIQDLSMPPPDGLNETQIEAVRVFITCLP